MEAIPNSTTATNNLTDENQYFDVDVENGGQQRQQQHHRPRNFLLGGPITTNSSPLMPLKSEPMESPMEDFFSTMNSTAIDGELGSLEDLFKMPDTDFKIENEDLSITDHPMEPWSWDEPNVSMDLFSSPIPPSSVTICPSDMDGIFI